MINKISSQNNIFKILSISLLSLFILNTYAKSNMLQNKIKLWGRGFHKFDFCGAQNMIVPHTDLGIPANNFYLDTLNLTKLRLEKEYKYLTEDATACSDDELFFIRKLDGVKHLYAYNFDDLNIPIWKMQLTDIISVDSIVATIADVKKIFMLITNKYNIKYLVGLTANNGSLLWQKQLTRELYSNNSIINIIDNKIILLAGNIILAYDINTGNELWRYTNSDTNIEYLTLENHLNSETLIISGKNAIYNNSDNSCSVIALSKSTGANFWTDSSSASCSAISKISIDNNNLVIAYSKLDTDYYNHYQLSLNNNTAPTILKQWHISDEFNKKRLELTDIKVIGNYIYSSNIGKVRVGTLDRLLSIIKKYNLPTENSTSLPNELSDYESSIIFNQYEAGIIFLGSKYYNEQLVYLSERGNLGFTN